MTSIKQHTETHATFVIERTFDVPLQRVWYALSDSAARDQWFGGGSAFDLEEKSHDFRVGGRAVETGRWHGGPSSRFEATYTDIVEHHRIVFSYDMWANERHLSTSLTTIVLEPAAAGTRLTYTEQGVHFDGLDTVEGREAGTRGLLDNLGAVLARLS
ncbi:MAG TPA: SRPBCC family protein [Ktedonobacterales bacterium]|nr:SRPBCC family protein [Ktedonobacterales bacterium]